MKKIFSLLFVSFLLIANSYAGKWTPSGSYSVSEDGDMRCYSSRSISVETGTISGNYDLSVPVYTDVAATVSAVLSGDSHFSLRTNPTATNVSGDYAYAYYYLLFDASELAGSPTPYTATLTITRDNGQTVSCALSATVTPEPAPTAGPVLDGVFSVSATKTVKFTRGNLYWDGSAWAMESAQTRYPKNWKTTHIGLLHWGPADNAIAESGEYSQTQLFCDGSDAEHKLTIEEATGLYALSNAEWDYLLNSRANAANLYRANVTIGSTYSNFVIAPDDFEGAIADYYTDAEFLTAQAAGLVCLPAAGTHYGASSYYTGSVYYWTATENTEYWSSAYYLGVQETTPGISSDNMTSAYAIRLVQETASEEGGEDGDDDPETPAVKPYLPGAFSVGAEKQVQFTTGNLFWDGTNWDIESAQNIAPTTRPANHVGHFFWMGAAEDAYAADFNEANRPTRSTLFFCDGSDDAHKLSLQGKNGFYALSKAEWDYLLGRTHTSVGGYDVPLYAYPVTVAGVQNCLVIAPDDFEGDFAPEYTLDELKEAGLVCLPPTSQGYYDDESNGYIIDTQLDLLGHSYYWTATNITYYSPLAYTIHAWVDSYEYSPGIFMNTPYVQPEEMNFEQCYALRLVRDYAEEDEEGEPDPEPEPEPEVFADGSLLPGVFSVSATKKVFFSRGNLLWDGSAWKMENTQYSRPTTLNPNHVSHLCWTTTAEKAHAESLGYSEGMALGDHLFCDGSDAEHMLSVDGVNNLFVLSYDEWHYLFNPYTGRPNAGYLYRYPVTVDGVECLVIAPDNYDYISSPLPASYDAEAFAAAEAAGIVCLPVMGLRIDDELLEENHWTYWTSTMSPDVREQAIAMVGTSYVNTEAGGYEIMGEVTDLRKTGRGIRLVQERIPGPQSTYTVYVKAPVCDGMNMEAGITGTFASGRVERMKRGADNWYSYTFTVEKEEGTGSFFFAEVAGSGISNYIRSIDGQEKYVVNYNLNEDQTFEIDLSNGYEWSRCEARQNNETSVREVHFHVERPVIGNSVPATITVDFVYLNNTVTETMDANWNRADATFMQGNWYYSNPNFVDIYSHGSMTDARYFWHIGDAVFETENPLMPTVSLNGLDIYKQPNDAVLNPAEVCTLEFDVRSQYPLSEQSFSWFVTTPDGEDHAASSIAAFTIERSSTISTLSFPATLLPAGDYKFWVYYSAKVNGSGETTSVYSRNAVVSVFEGGVVSAAEGGTGSYSPRTGTMILDDYATDAETTETAAAIIRETATISYAGTVVIDASETGFEMGGTVVIESEDDATMTIRAPKPIYSPRETSELILDGIDMTLDAEDADGPVLAPRRAVAHAAYMAPRRALLENTEHSVISGFASLDLQGCQVVSPRGAGYDTEARELMVGGVPVKHAIIRASATPDYTRDITPGKIGTICLPNAVANGDAYGATFYELSYIDDDQLYFDQVTSLEAGMPYLFVPEAEASRIECYYTGDAVAVPGHKNGLYGAFDQTLIGGDADNYVIYNNRYRRVGAQTYVGENRAYIRLSEVSTTAPAPSPKRIALSCDNSDVATGWEDIYDGEAPVKLIMDDHIMIIHDGHTYTAEGQLVK